MTLKVTEHDLDLFAGLVHRASADTAEALRYVASYGQIDGGESSLFAEVFTKHEDVIPAINRTFTKLHDVLARSAVELRQAAAYYRETDRRAAERFDAALSRTKR